MKNPKVVKFNHRDFDPIKAIALTFPGAEESISHEGTPSIKVRGKLMCRLHDNGEFIPIRLDFHLRDAYLEKYPELFRVPAHFKAYPYICMNTSGYTKKLLQEILELSWRGLASKKQVTEFEIRNRQQV
ncbi:MAG: MmcQ/YjbR family DNA-binding protein [Cyclobacteriaceae bacterium]|nr:MmcQ/YjbR family DNA-binding protein [Cyclobacteriaceae bacterium]